MKHSPRHLVLESLDYSIPSLGSLECIQDYLRDQIYATKAFKNLNLRIRYTKLITMIWMLSNQF